MKIVKILVIVFLLIGFLQIGIVESSNRQLEKKLSIDKKISFDFANKQLRKDLSNAKKISFEFINGFIIVNGKINGSEKEYNFMFDTGASTSVVDSDCAQKLNLKKCILKKWMKGISNKGRFLSKVKLKNLKLGNLEFSNIKAVTTDLNALEEYIGRELHGVIGGNILKKFAITINYDKRYIVFSDKEYYKQTNKQNKMDIKMKENLFLFAKSTPEIKGSIYNGKIDLNIRIDTGFNGEVSIPVKKVKTIKKKFKNSLIKVRGTSTRGVYKGNKDSYLIKLENFNIEIITIDKIISDIHNFNIALLGNEFLKDFIVELNYPQNVVSLYWKGSIEYNLVGTFGLGITKEKKGFIISTIIKNSSADLSGLKVGDKILEMNSKKIDDLSIEKINSILRNKDELHLKYKRENRIKEVILERKDIWN